MASGRLDKVHEEMENTLEEKRFATTSGDAVLSSCKADLRKQSVDIEKQRTESHVQQILSQPD